jgi:hypothetical protein
MWILLAGAAHGAPDPGPPLLREPPPYGSPPKVEWIVRYADGSPLDTPSFMQITDAPVALREEYRRAQNRRMATGVTLGAAGSAIALGGFVAATVIAVNTYDEENATFETTGIAIAGGVAGMVLALTSIGPLTKHSRHRKYPSMALTEEQADELIEHHNAALATP